MTVCALLKLLPHESPGALPAYTPGGLAMQYGVVFPQTEFGNDP
jgi:hypothetical protein